MLGKEKGVDYSLLKDTAQNTTYRRISIRYKFSAIFSTPNALFRILFNGLVIFSAINREK